MRSTKKRLLMGSVGSRVPKAKLTGVEKLFMPGFRGR